MLVAPTGTAAAQDVIQTGLAGIRGLRMAKSWHVFNTRFFYFSAGYLTGPSDNGLGYLGLECSWRLQRDSQLLVGKGDYGIAAKSNHDPNWNPSEMQWGHLQNELLADLLGEERQGEIYAIPSRPALIVESVDCDPAGGVHLGFGHGLSLVLFPDSSTDMQWWFSYADGAMVSVFGREASWRTAEDKRQAEIA